MRKINEVKLNFSTYIYPILITNQLESTFIVDDKVLIRKISNEERREFFGIDKIDVLLSETPPYVHVSKIKTSEKNNNQAIRFDHKKWHIPYLLLNKDAVFASNSVVVIKSSGSPDFLVDKINLCFNLLSPTATHCSLGFKKGGNDVSFHYRKYANYFKFLEFDSKKQKWFKKVWGRLDKASKSNLSTIENLYIKCIHDDTSLEVRFLLAVIALEVLFLPGVYTELSYRFSLRGAKILEKISGEPIKSNFELLRKIYKTRFKIVHQGSSSKINVELFDESLRIFNIVFHLYLEDPSIFDQKNLELLCLA